MTTKNFVTAVGALVGVAGLSYGVGAFVTENALGTDAIAYDVERIEAQLELFSTKYEALPIGAIIAWDPVSRDDEGNPIQRSPVPHGWQICDGLSGSPDLAGRFIRGAVGVDDAGVTGGTDVIPSGGAHGHLQTGRPLERGYHGTQGDKAPYNGSGDNLSEHVHDISESNSHDHGGDNLPPYYDLVYIVKIPL